MLGRLRSTKPQSMTNRPVGNMGPRMADAWRGFYFAFYFTFFGFRRSLLAGRDMLL